VTRRQDFEGHRWTKYTIPLSRLELNLNDIFIRQEPSTSGLQAASHNDSREPGGSGGIRPQCFSDGTCHSIQILANLPGSTHILPAKRVSMNRYATGWVRNAPRCPSMWTNATACDHIRMDGPSQIRDFCPMLPFIHDRLVHGSNRYVSISLHNRLLIQRELERGVIRGGQLVRNDVAGKHPFIKEVQLDFTWKLSTTNEIIIHRMLSINCSDKDARWMEVYWGRGSCGTS